MNCSTHTESDHGDEHGVLYGVPPGPEAHLGLGPRQDLLAEAGVQHHHRAGGDGQLMNALIGGHAAAASGERRPTAC